MNNISKINKVIARRRRGGHKYARFGAMNSSVEAAVRASGYIVTRKQSKASAYTVVSWPNE